MIVLVGTLNVALGTLSRSFAHSQNVILRSRINELECQIEGVELMGKALARALEEAAAGLKLNTSQVRLHIQRLEGFRLQNASALKSPNADVLKSQDAIRKSALFSSVGLICVGTAIWGYGDCMVHAIWGRENCLI